MFNRGTLAMGLLVAAALTGCEEEDAPKNDSVVSPPSPPVTQSDLVARPLGVIVTGNGIVTSKAVGISCTTDESTGAQTGTCQVRATDDDVSLVASADPGWTFDHWAVKRGDEPDRAFVVSPDHSGTLKLTGVTQVSSTTVEAVFVPNKPFSVDILAPMNGLAGSKVSISGNRLGGARATVTFAGTPAEVLADSTESELHVIVPPGATSGKVVVENGTQRSDKLWFKVGVASAHWKVEWPANRVCFDVNDGWPTQFNALPIANEPSPTPDGNVAGFSMLFLVNPVHGDPDHNGVFTLAGALSVDGSFAVTASPTPDVSYEATGTLASNGSASGWITIRVVQNDFTCIESGHFTINE